MISRIKDVVVFVRKEALSGVLLLLAAAIAILMNNSEFSGLYNGLTHTTVSINVSQSIVTINIHEIVNDFLMSIFFLLVGLEIKREFLVGQLADRSTALLPLIGALGGMIVPALIYVYFNSHNPAFMKGWAIPTATDIAFSLGILSLFGRSLPFSLKVFLTALAIIDDLLAIIIIAFFYTAQLSAQNLFFAGLIFAGLILLNKSGVKRLHYYLLPGLLMFYLIHHSGVHATVAGVLLALTIPLKGDTPKSKSPLKELEHSLHPWVSYIILPVFAFVNGGVSLKGLDFSVIYHPITLGCLLGLFIGKQTGVFLASYVGIKLNFVKLPEGATFMQCYGVSILTGIGFTMSLFIGGLAFTDESVMAMVKVGVIGGSILSTLVGVFILLFCRISSEKNILKTPL